jgi:hypothetical protein
MQAHTAALDTDEQEQASARLARLPVLNSVIPDVKVAMQCTTVAKPYLFLMKISPPYACASGVKPLHCNESLVNSIPDLGTQYAHDCSLPHSNMAYLDS